MDDLQQRIKAALHAAQMMEIIYLGSRTALALRDLAAEIGEAIDDDDDQL